VSQEPESEVVIEARLLSFADIIRDEYRTHPDRFRWRLVDVRLEMGDGLLMTVGEWGTGSRFRTGSIARDMACYSPDLPGVARGILDHLLAEDKKPSQPS
jgi:hypothetical protein